MTSFKFRRQFPIGGFIADFCCRKNRLGIEIDGANTPRTQPELQLTAGAAPYSRRGDTA